MRGGSRLCRYAVPPSYIGWMGFLQFAFLRDGGRIHAAQSAIHAIGVRKVAVFYDIKSESQRR